MGQHHRGFTLVELLVVVAIIAVLAGLLFPVFAAARGKAHQAKCLNNQRQIALAVSIWTSDHDDMLPKGDTVWQDINIDRQVLSCPSADDKGGEGPQNNYVYNSYIAGKRLTAQREVTNTMITADGYHDVGVSPNTIPNVAYTYTDLEFRHQKGVNMSFIDGHVSLIQNPLDIPIDFREAPAAEFQSLDRTTGGSFWRFSGGGRYRYGSKGYALCFWDSTDPAVYGLTGGYVSNVVPTGQTNTAWAASGTQDPRAVVNPATNFRAADSWEGNCTFDVSLADAADDTSHTMAIYCLDWNGTGASQNISILAGSEALMQKPYTVSNFNNGAWVLFRFKGNVTVKVEGANGSASAYVSAIAFD